MRCPECNSQIEVIYLGGNLYRIDCTSIGCYFTDEFEYEQEVEVKQESPIRRNFLVAA